MEVSQMHSSLKYQDGGGGEGGFQTANNDGMNSASDRGIAGTEKLMVSYKIENCRASFVYICIL